MRLVTLILGTLLPTTSLSAAPTTLATFAPDLTREGPGLLLRDLLREDDTAIQQTIDLIVARSPDILLLTGVDWDQGNASISALKDRLTQRGLLYPHAFAPRSNRGLATGLDMDGDGRTGGPGDAQGWAPFTGAGSIALFSRFPIETDGIIDLSDLLWKDLPGAVLPTTASGSPYPSTAAHSIQRLSSTGHWIVPIRVSDRTLMKVAIFHATPPVFDGPEDANGLRNRDETRIWTLWLDGNLPQSGPPASTDRVTIMGRANLDPNDGEGHRDAIRTLMAHPRLSDPAPQSTTAIQTKGHIGVPEQDTARYRAPPNGPGNLRLDVLLPDRALPIINSGIDWPANATSDAGNGLVWITVDTP